MGRSNRRREQLKEEEEEAPAERCSFGREEMRKKEIESQRHRETESVRFEERKTQRMKERVSDREEARRQSERLLAAEVRNIDLHYRLCVSCCCMIFVTTDEKLFGNCNLLNVT